MNLESEKSCPACGGPTSVWVFSRYPQRVQDGLVVLLDAVVRVCSACHMGFAVRAQAEKEVAA